MNVAEELRALYSPEQQRSLDAVREAFLARPVSEEQQDAKQEERA